MYAYIIKYATVLTGTHGKLLQYDHYTVAYITHILGIQTFTRSYGIIFNCSDKACIWALYDFIIYMYVYVYMYMQYKHNKRIISWMILY